MEPSECGRIAKVVSSVGGRICRTVVDGMHCKSVKLRAGRKCLEAAGWHIRVVGGSIVTEKSRTEYSARNTTVAMAAKVISILAGYFTRVVFTHTFSEAYVGINGLFTDILNVLALSELGVGTAITYALYKPIAGKNVEKQKALVRLYRQLYRLVALVVLCGGLFVLPFLDVLVKGDTQIAHLPVIYLLYLLNSVLSYLLIYKKTLIDAHQLSYISTLYQTMFLILQNGMQIAVLLFTGNFLLFVLIQIGCTIVNNISISGKAERMYPYLKEKNVQKLSGEERGAIFRNIRAMLMHKIGSVLVNNTDNLLLSSLVGITSTGLYSNYYLVIGSVRQVLEQLFVGITASVGNLGAREEDGDHVRKVFEAAFFVAQWISGLSAICLFELIDSFVSFSFGARYVFPREVTLVLCLNFYLVGMRQAILVFRNSMGLFWYDRYVALVEAAINLVASVILGRLLGVVGIFLGTLVSTVTTSLWVEPFMLYKHRLKVSSRRYFLRYALYAAVTILMWAGLDYLCRGISGSFWKVCFFRLPICFCVINLVYFLLYHRTKEFRMLTRKARGLLQRKRHAGQGSDRCMEENTECGAEEACMLLLLQGKPVSSCGSVDWNRLSAMAKRHSVLSLFHGPLTEAGDSVPASVRAETEKSARQTVMQSYHLLFLCKYLTGRLEAAGNPVVILKGVGTASYYPVPELRKSGDVDLLLLNPDRLEEACGILEKCGCSVEERQLTLHHVVFASGEGIAVELHTMLSEPFDNKMINGYLKHTLANCRQHVVRADIMGVKLPILGPCYHAYELLLHMLQHFLRAGFGLKLLYDWVMFWSHEVDWEERKQYLMLVEDSGIKGFSDTVTAACCKYLGLDRTKVDWMEIMAEEEAVSDFMADVLEAEEFGKSASERMVILRSAGLFGYVREFHHQTCLNYPKASGIILLLPMLWILTLLRFLYNNRKIRKVSCRKVLKNAGQRSRLIARMGLWK